MAQRLPKKGEAEKQLFQPPLKPAKGQGGLYPELPGKTCFKGVGKWRAGVFTGTEKPGG